MLSEEPEREQRKQETEKLMDWALQAIISWSVGLLTVFFGLMTLLVEMKLHGGIGTELTCILSIVYILLAIALGVSIIRIGSLYGELWQFQMSLPEKMQKRFGTQLYLNLFIDRKNNKVRTKIFLGLAVFFCAVLILAWFV